MPAPVGRPEVFWKNRDQEWLLLTTYLALTPTHVLKQIDAEYVAAVVGEGRLTVKSMIAKRTSLILEGRQRIADHEARQTAGNENIDRSELVLPSMEQTLVVKTDTKPMQTEARIEFELPSTSSQQHPSQTTQASGPPHKKRKRSMPSTNVARNTQRSSQVCSDTANNQQDGGTISHPRTEVSYTFFGGASDQSLDLPSQKSSESTLGSLGKPISLEESDEDPPDKGYVSPPRSQKRAKKSHASDSNESPMATAATKRTSAKESQNKRKDTKADTAELEDNELPTSYQKPESQQNHRKKGRPGWQSDLSANQQRNDSKAEAKQSRRPPSGKIHTKAVSNRTRQWQASATREISVTASEMGRYENGGLAMR